MIKITKRKPYSPRRQLDEENFVGVTQRYGIQHDACAPKISVEDSLVVLVCGDTNVSLHADQARTVAKALMIAADLADYELDV